MRNRFCLSPIFYSSNYSLCLVSQFGHDTEMILIKFDETICVSNLVSIVADFTFSNIKLKTVKANMYFLVHGQFSALKKNCFMRLGSKSKSNKLLHDQGQMWNW